VADVEINVSGVPDEGRPKNTKTAKDGTYSIELSPGEHYWINVLPPEEGRLLHQRLTDVNLEEDKKLNIKLEFGFILSGRITDNKGKPVANTWISANPTSGGQSEGGRASSDGNYRIKLAAGTYTLKIYPPEDRKLPRQTVSDVEVKEDLKLDIKLESGFTLSGLITNPDGEPITYAHVIARENTTGQEGYGSPAKDGFYSIVLMPGTYTVQLDCFSQTIKDVKVEKDTTLDITVTGENQCFLDGEASDVSQQDKKAISWGKVKRNALLQNYPNPFNPETWMPYLLAETSDVTIQIYSITGQTLRTLEIGRKDSGEYVSKAEAAYWDGRNDAGERVASGVYFYRIQAGNFTAMRKLLVSE